MVWVQKVILGWYQSNKRDLPWRKTRDVYQILVSEIMLQQTQVDRVIPKYLAFLDQFPTASSLAKASPSEVIIAWSGLGYNRRALFLQRAAQVLAKEIPSDLQDLPGVGPYTARAVECFALGKDVPVVDTNIRRIFSRLFFEGAGTQEGIDAQVAKAVPSGQGIAWNNALMDFGSMICTAESPKCTSCPLKAKCSAFKTGNQDKYLRVAPKQKPFAGSRRFYRGQVLRLAKEPISLADLARSLKKSKIWTKKLTDELAKEGLVSVKGNTVSLPLSL